jgi:hypothetical protein
MRRRAVWYIGTEVKPEPQSRPACLLRPQTGRRDVSKAVPCRACGHHTTQVYGSANGVAPRILSIGTTEVIGPALSCGRFAHVVCSIVLRGG